MPTSVRVSLTKARSSMAWSCVRPEDCSGLSLSKLCRTCSMSGTTCFTIYVINAYVLSGCARLNMCTGLVDLRCDCEILYPPLNAVDGWMACREDVPDEKWSPGFSYRVREHDSNRFEVMTRLCRQLTKTCESALLASSWCHHSAQCTT